MDEGLVSRYFNRRASRPLAQLLSRTRVTPNQVTAASFAVALGAAIAFAAGELVVGGLLAQASSVLDGVDGDLARLKNRTTAFGAFFDAVLDRYADTAILLGMMLYMGEPYTRAWLVGLAALVGSLMVSYTRARAEANTGVRFQTGFASFATRDMRLALVCLGALTGAIFWTLVALAALTNAVVLVRILFAWRVLK
jgi:phosphatidylglycerophosphate synthase